MDTKLVTFLTLCRLMNYRLTAEALHLTQPAVTRQIQALESEYHVKLFSYDGRALHKTRACEILQGHCESLAYSYGELEKALLECEETMIRIGATKTIGDYVIGPHVERHLSVPGQNLSLIVDNTEHLLIMLDHGELDFAFIEGPFQKSKYDFQFFRREPFVGVCPKEHPLALHKVPLREALKYPLIVREEGSGTREILLNMLRGLGYDLSSFQRVVSISSFKLIRELVLDGFGISFLYQAVISDDASLSTFSVEEFSPAFDFHVVYLKNTHAKAYADRFLNRSLPDV